MDLSWGRNWQDSPGYFTDTIFTNNDLDMYNSAMQGKGENRLYSLFVGNSDVSRLPATEFRDMVLRRLRTVMDGYFSAPGVLENRFAQLADLMDPPAIGTSDADRDRTKWGTWGNDGGNTIGGVAMRYHINQIRNVYLPGRRTFLNSATLAGSRRSAVAARERRRSHHDRDGRFQSRHRNAGPRVFRRPQLEYLRRRCFRMADHRRD